jgi:hypothetical protein
MAAGTLPYSSKKELAEEGPTSKGVVIDIFPGINGVGVTSPNWSIVGKEERFNQEEAGVGALLY